MPCNHPIWPDGSRRRFLGQLGAGFGTLAFEALLRQEARAAAPSQRPVIDPLQPFAPRAPHFAPRAKSVIFLFMVGGPSQVDTFDYKPELQKLSGQPLPASLRASAAEPKFANVTHGCEDKLLGSPYAWQPIRRVRHVGQRAVSARRPARRRSVLHPLDAGRFEQSRAGQLPASHRRRARRQGEPRLVDDLRPWLREPGFAGLRRAVRRRAARRGGELFERISAGRVSADSLARQGHAGPRSAAA